MVADVMLPKKQQNGNLAPTETLARVSAYGYRPVTPNGLVWITATFDPDSHNRLGSRLFESKPTVSKMGDRWLVVQNAQLEQYSPLKYSSLFRDFSGLDPTEEQFAGFAQKWGPLGCWRGLVREGAALTAKGVIGRLGRVRNPWATNAAGESFVDWSNIHARMSTILRVYDSAQSDGKEIRQWYLEAGGAATFSPPNPIFHTRTFPIVFAHRWGALKNVHQRARFIALSWCAENISVEIAGCYPMLRMWEQPGLVLLARSLLDTLWLQLAHEISGGTKHRQCEGCLTWFRVGDGQGERRTDATLCGNPSCKMRARRRRLAAEREQKRYRPPAKRRRK